MLSQIMEYLISNLLNIKDRWHANCTDPALEQQKHITVKATLIKRYKHCIKIFVSVSQCFFKTYPSLEKKKPALVKQYRIWSPANSEQPLHEYKLIHDIRKGRNIYWCSALQSLSLDYKSRPYNTDFIQYALFANFKSVLIR